MPLFETLLVLLFVAVLLLQISRRLGAPYPALLALAGVGVGALPWAPHVEIEPHLALALFVAPVLLDAAYDTAPRDLRRNWVPLLSLVLVAVLLTTLAVALAGRTLGGLPWGAAVALGAIVAPPDAAAASAVLGQFQLPRHTLNILKGESLLNDAVALLIFGAAVSMTESARTLTADRTHPQAASEHDRLRAEAITVQRRVLETLRDEERIGEDTYHRLEEELDWSELAVASSEQLELQDT